MQYTGRMVNGRMFESAGRCHDRHLCFAGPGKMQMHWQVADDSECADLIVELEAMKWE